MLLSTKGSIRDIALGSTVTVILFIAYTTLPLFGILVGVFAPFPAAYFSLRSGRAVGFAIVAVATVVVLVAGGAPVAILYLLQSALVSLALPLFLSRGSGASKTIAYTVALTVSVAAIAALLFSLARGVDLHGQIQQGIHTSIAQTVAIYEKGGLSGEELGNFKAGMEEAGKLLGQIYPALVVIFSGLLAGVNLMMLKLASARIPHLPEMAPFSRFRNPDQLVWALIVGGFALLTSEPLVDRLALNVLLVLAALYAAQGLAIVVHSFNAYRVPLFMRLLFYFVMVVQPYLLIALAVLGLFDLWANFRTPRPQKNL